MTKQKYLEFAKAFFNDCIETSRAKGEDYTNGAIKDDAFANFTAVGEDWTEIGFFTRMMDKMSRLKSFIKKGELQVKDESVADSLKDLANYSCLLAAYLKSKQNGE
jgi:anti-sigma28 factor (negative regulator of flagellin synthesis)